MKTDPTRSKVYDQSVAATTTVTTGDIDVSGYTEMTVIWRLMATVTGADLTLNDAKPTVEDPAGTDVFVDQAMASQSAVAPASDGANVVAQKTYRLAGLKTIRITGRNNNLAAKTLKIYVLLT